MAWTYLFLASFFEVIWVIALKQSHGFTRLWPSMITAVFGSLSLFLLSQAIKTLPLGISYAIWTGFGVVGTVIIGFILFDESPSAIQILALALILAGIILLRVFSGTVS